LEKAYTEFTESTKFAEKRDARETQETQDPGTNSVPGATAELVEEERRWKS